MGDCSCKRIVWLDVCGVLACFLVVLYHVPQYTSYVKIDVSSLGSKGLYDLAFFIGRCAVPIFFIISGFLILPVEKGMYSFLKSRFLRVVIPTVFWIIVYSLFAKVPDSSVSGVLAHCGHLWYMLALIGLYLVAPIISPWLKSASNKDILFVLIVWLITLCFTVFNFFHQIKLDYSHKGWLFANPCFIFLYYSGYIGYFILGFFLKKNYDVIAKSKYMTITCLSIGFAVSYVLIYLLGVDPSQSNAYLSIPTLFFTLFLIFLVIWLCGRIKCDDVCSKLKDNWLSRLLFDISKCSFGIYLIHVFFLEYIRVDSLNGYNRLAISIVAFLCCYLFIKIVSLLPGSKYVVGC